MMAGLQRWGLMISLLTALILRVAVCGLMPQELTRDRDAYLSLARQVVPILWEATDLITLVGGGAGGKSMFLPTAGGQSLAVSKPVETR